MASPRCKNGHLVDPTEKFCGECRAPLAAHVPQESAESIATYQEALTEFWSDGVLEDWEEEELARLRAELGITEATHAALSSGYQPLKEALSVALEVDATSVQDFVAGTHGIIRARLLNGGKRPLKNACIRHAVPGVALLAEHQARVLRPGGHELFSVMMELTKAGHFQLLAAVRVEDMLGKGMHLRADPLPYRVGTTAPQAHVVNIDASAMRVGDLSGMQIGAPGSARGGVLGEARWVLLRLQTITEADWLAFEATHDGGKRRAEEARREEEAARAREEKERAERRRTEAEASARAEKERLEAARRAEAGRRAAAEAEAERRSRQAREEKEQAERRRAAAEASALAEQEKLEAARQTEAGRRARLTREVIVDPQGAGDVKTLDEALMLVGAGGVIQVRSGTYCASLSLDRDVTLQATGGAVTLYAQGERPVVTVVAGNPVLRGLTLEQRSPRATPKEGPSLPIKKDIALSILERSSVFVHLDPRKEGVVVPPEFKKQPKMVLQVGHKMTVPIPDLSFDDLGMSCTLSFNKKPFLCAVPWSSVFALVGEDKRGAIWPDAPATPASDDESLRSAVLVTGGSPTLMDCVLRSKAACGLLARGKDAAPLLWRCWVGEAGTSGLRFDLSARGKVEGCTTVGATGAGITVQSQANPGVKGCKFHGCGGPGIDVGGGGLGTFDGCESYKNKMAGIQVADKGTNPTIRDCKFHGSLEGEGLSLSGGALGWFEGCESYENKLAGIKVGGEGTFPRVKSCKFHGSMERQGISVLEGAKGTFEGCESYENRLAGIQIAGKGAVPKVKNCKFRGSLEGEGISVVKGARGTFEGCESYQNQMSGIQLTGEGTDPRVQGCKFHGSLTIGGIHVSDAAAGFFEGCESYQNTMAGIQVTGAGSNPSVQNCKFHGSLEDSGIYVGNGGRGTFDGCESYENRGGGISVRDTGTNPTVQNCRFHGCDVAGIYVGDGAQGTLEGCESYENKVAGIEIRGQGTNPTIRRCKLLGAVLAGEGKELHHVLGGLRGSTLLVLWSDGQRYPVTLLDVTPGHALVAWANGGQTWVPLASI